MKIVIVLVVVIGRLSVFSETADNEDEDDDYFGGGDHSIVVT